MANDNLALIILQDYRFCGHSFFPYHSLDKAMSKDNAINKKLCLETLDTIQKKKENHISFSDSSCCSGFFRSWVSELQSLLSLHLTNLYKKKIISG